MGKGVPDSFWLSPLPPGISGECTAAPARFSYPGSTLKILVLQDTLNEGSTREWTAEKAQLPLLFLLHCPTRPFSLGIRDRTSKTPTFALLTIRQPPPHPHTLSGSFQITEINPSKDGHGSNLLTTVLECQPLGIVAPRAKGENV